MFVVTNACSSPLSVCLRSLSSARRPPGAADASSPEDGCSLIIQNMTRDTAAALTWITELLFQRGIPFQAVGGLAARAYGASRELHDLDFYIPTERFDELADDLAPHLTRAPQPHRDSSWDLTFAQLLYAGQKIELGGADGALFFDSRTGEWKEQRVDFSRSVHREVFGVIVPVMPKDELIAYKAALDRAVDRQDLAELRRV